MKKRQMGEAKRYLFQAIAIFSAAALLAGCGASGSAEYKNAADEFDKTLLKMIETTE